MQERRDKDYRLLAEILGWFDLIALQEVNDNLTGLRAIHQHLGADYRLVFSDASGNDERMTFVYDATKLALLEEVGEVAPPPSDYRHITLPGIQQRFDGFDRNPYLATFRAGAFTFSLVNVHLYFGSDSAMARNRRSLEAYAVARWADNRRKSRHAVTSDIIPLGDFNLPQTQPGDPIFDALTKRGLQLPPHSTKIAASIASDNQYDQIAFFPGDTRQDFTGQIGVFDFDGAVFAHLWQTRTRQEFLAYVRYYLSDQPPPLGLVQDPALTRGVLSHRWCAAVMPRPSRVVWRMTRNSSQVGQVNGSIIRTRQRVARPRSRRRREPRGG